MRPTSLQILALWTLAAVQPVLDLLGRSPEFFVAHRATSGDIWLLLIGLLLLVPLALSGCVWLASLAGERARHSMLLVIVTALASIFFLQIAGRVGLDEWRAAMPLSFIAGVAAAAIFHRVSLVRTFVSVLAVSVIVVPAVFMTRPGVRRLVIQSGGTVANSAGHERARRPVPIVLIVFDELPLLSLLDAAGTLDQQRYPRFAQVARDGVWFRNATTVSGYTRWALPPILTGRYPVLESVPTPADHPDTLFTLLARTHTLEVTEALTDLCPQELCARELVPRGTRLRRMAVDLAAVLLHVTITRDLRDHLPDITRTWAGFAGDASGAPRTWQARWAQADSSNRTEILQRPEVVRSFVNAISATDRQPTFYFLHSLITHVPYLFLPTGQLSVTRTPIPGPGPTTGHDDEWAVAQQHQRHLLQVGFLDALVGQLVDRLKSEGLYDRTLLILTADHGAAYSPGEPLRSVTDANAAEVMRIPLLIKFPTTSSVDRLFPRDRNSGLRMTDRNVETVDIVPTVADVVDARLPWMVDGVSLLRPDPRRPAKRLTDRTGIREYESEGPTLHRALQRKTALFDGVSNAFQVPRPSAFGALMGRRVADFRVGPSTGSIEIHQRWRYVHVDTRAAEVPFDVTGRLSAPTASRRYLALAVNGVISAVTATWKHKPQDWAATLPLDVWTRGRNQLDIFALEGTPDSPLLRRLNARTVRLGELNLVSGEAELLWGVKMRGFYRSEGTRTASFRWTRGHGTLVVPRAGTRPHTLRVTIARAAVPSSRLKVSVNDCTLFDGALSAREWEGAFPLDRCAIDQDEIRVTLASDFRTGPGGDRRRLGVAVRRVVLQD
jgi:arylsulfatase A-like enzyme